jgi:hypothetical protein
MIQLVNRECRALGWRARFNNDGSLPKALGLFDRLNSGCKLYSLIAHQPE